jgi:phage tail protein X
MKTTHVVGRALLAVGLAVMLTGAQQAPKTEFISHKVARGETVSLICIRHYGRYSAELAESIKAANPSVGNLNMVKPGMTIRLRKPIAAQDPARAALPEKEVEIFQQSVQANQGVVTYAKGTLNLTRGGTKSAVGANTILEPGDVLETGADGRAEIIINRESVVRMKEHSRVTIDALRDATTDKGKTKVGFSLGTVWTKVRETKDRICRFELELPTAIAGVHGTVYQTTVAGDKSAEVKVYNGEVAVSGKQANSPSAAGEGEMAGPDEVPGPDEVTMEEWIQIVRSMQRIAIDKGGQATKPSDFARKADDEWEKFNEERDGQIHVLIGLALPLPK